MFQLLHSRDFHTVQTESCRSQAVLILSRFFLNIMLVVNYVVYNEMTSLETNTTIAAAVSAAHPEHCNHIEGFPCLDVLSPVSIQTQATHATQALALRALRAMRA